MPIINTTVEKESRDRYLTYALSVVSARALPDVRDGLKPVQRRILFDMYKFLNLNPQGSHRKSAAVVGGVLARFHPHGDVACYDAMVRMAQDFSLRYPLIDGQGNFGSLDGDSAAAYRYTEAKLRELAIEVIGEIDEETVAFRDNFDGTQREPVVLPSRVPNLLMNGAMGIAVGMATSIPPHNLKDITNALTGLLEDPELSDAKLARAIKGPDFPTGCSILNTQDELTEIYRTGRGMVRMRGDWELEDLPRGKKAIVVTSIPFTVAKSQLVEKIATLIGDKKVPQLNDIRDESTDKVRVVLELTAGADAEVAMAYIFKNTPLESNFNVNLTALVPVEGSDTARPEQLSLKKMLQHFLDFRVEVIQKRLAYERKKLLERIHILEGLVLIYDAIDEVIRIVRKSDGRQDSAEKLRARFKLTEIQAYAVVDMRIYQLSKTTVAEIKAELAAKEKRVAEIDELLKSKRKIQGVLKRELEELAEKYGDKRRSKLVKDNVELEFRAEDYIVEEEVYAIVTRDGWLKRIRQNNELGTTRLREGDSIMRAHPISTRDTVVFFTNLGNCYSLKASDFPASSGYGEPVQKILKFKDGESIVESLALKASEVQGSLLQSYRHVVSEGDVLALVSEQGMGFAHKLEGVAELKRSGKRVMKVREGDKMAAVCVLAKRVGLISRDGYALAVEGKEIPEREGSSVGVILMGIKGEDGVVAALPLGGKSKLTLSLEGGSTKDIESSELEEGRRGLKGKRVIARGKILRVEKA